MIAKNPLSPNVEQVSGRILTVRGLKVILDADLAALYGVPTKRFNEQVRRNSSRFPADFMFQLSGEEAESAELLSAIRTLMSSPERKGRPIGFVRPGEQ